MVHRDIKPSNIMITDDGVVKVMDLGLVKLLTKKEPADPTLTATGAYTGSPLYSAPEQMGDSAHVDHRCDIWSLGVVFVQCLVGHHPYGSIGSSPLKVAKALADGEIDPSKPLKLFPGLPDLAYQMTRRALRKEPEARYQSVGDFLKDLERLPGAARWMRRRIWGLRAASMLAAVLLLALFGLWFRTHSPNSVGIPSGTGISGGINFAASAESPLKKTRLQLSKDNPGLLSDAVYLSQDGKTARIMESAELRSLDALSQIHDSLEVLDVSGCPNVDWRTAKDLPKSVRLICSGIPPDFILEGRDVTGLE
jgi:serine/threonine protein kinase